MYRYMDEIGLRNDDMTKEIGNRASYSIHQVTDQDRQVMLAVLDGAKRKIHAEKAPKKESKIKSLAGKKIGKKEK